VLRLLEGEQLVAGLSGAKRAAQDSDRTNAPAQLPLFHEVHPVLERLRTIDVNQLTPMESLSTLDELARIARQEAR
jgi:hypothetical protein